MSQRNTFVTSSLSKLKLHSSVELMYGEKSWSRAKIKSFRLRNTGKVGVIMEISIRYTDGPNFEPVFRIRIQIQSFSKSGSGIGIRIQGLKKGLKC